MIKLTMLNIYISLHKKLSKTLRRYLSTPEMIFETKITNVGSLHSILRELLEDKKINTSNSI